ncbi:MAG TPA: dihydroorotate dehydrogenase [Bacteroidales bacterium]|nr:dihydroorotate dehydrogenase [Bacteroidales bacterium]
MADLSVSINGIGFRNPVMTASGTFGYGEEYTDFIDIGRLGGFVTKAISVKPRKGNPYPRMAETPYGMLNAIGLQNKGLDYFIHNIYPRIKDFDTRIIANVAESTTEGYVEVARALNALDRVDALELNISCPNVKEGGLAFGTSCPMSAAVTRAVKEVYDKPLWVKLSPNVTDIVDIARGVEDAGADGLCVINTLVGMAIHAGTRRPVLSTITGGLSGPAIKPVALRMVWQVYQAVDIPIIGIGGIRNGTDAVEFMLAGASAVQVGTMNFIDPTIALQVAEGIDAYCDQHGFARASELTGALILD